MIGCLPSKGNALGGSKKKEEEEEEREEEEAVGEKKSSYRKRKKRSCLFLYVRCLSGSLTITPSSLLLSVNQSLVLGQMGS